MDRRSFLTRAGVTASVAATFPAPAIAQSIRELKIVTSWPKGLPGLGTSAERLGRAITEVTGGRLKVQVFGAGQLVSAFEVFDAVSSGVADMYHSAEYYWEKRSPAFNFFAAVPFGFTANELFAWVQYGGGQELWDALSGQFNIKPLLCLNTGTQMGGWCTREVPSPDAFRGLRYRMPGLGGEVLRRLGAIAVTVPGGEIVQSLKSGAIDGGEWVGPWLDMDLGLHKVAGYYYYPGFHEPGTGSTLGINKRLWDSFDASDRQLVEDATAAEYTRSLAEFDFNNALSLRRLRDEGAVKILKFDDSVLKELYRISKEVVAEAGSGDDLSKKIYASYQQSFLLIIEWSHIAESAVLNSRRLA
jgi:TRAP-type mannitol/chloroaromatic compound transport system substrate-binding protein